MLSSGLRDYCDFDPGERLDIIDQALPEGFGPVQIVNQLRVRNNPLPALPAGSATMRATIDITGTNIAPEKLSQETRARISTEKPPGSNDPDAIVVLKPDKVKADKRPR